MVEWVDDGCFIFIMLHTVIQNINIHEMYDKIYIFRAKDWIGQTIQVNTGPFLKKSFEYGN